MEKARPTGKDLFSSGRVVMALVIGYFAGKLLSGKHVSHQKAPKCERCQKNPTRVRIDQMIDGRRESHFLCQSCVDELMKSRYDEFPDSHQKSS